jgi:hypothetical protein
VKEAEELAAKTPNSQACRPTQLRDLGVDIAQYDYEYFDVDIKISKSHAKEWSFFKIPWPSMKDSLVPFVRGWKSRDTGKFVFCDALPCKNPGIKITTEYEGKFSRITAGYEGDFYYIDESWLRSVGLSPLE